MQWESDPQRQLLILSSRKFSLFCDTSRQSSHLCAGFACQRIVAVCPSALAHTDRTPAEGFFLVLRPERYRLSIPAPQIPLQRAYSFQGTVLDCSYGHRCCGQTPPNCEVPGRRYSFVESILGEFECCPLHRRLALRAAPPHRAPLSGWVGTSVGKSCISFWLRKRKVRRSLSLGRLLRIVLRLALFGYVWGCFSR